MTSEVIYEGELRTRATHLRSGTVIQTDAPVDNQGKGEAFSPTDLAATSLAACMCTIMGIAARTHSIAIEGMRCEIEKIMASNPRRIGEIKIQVHLPAGKTYSEKEQKILEHAALTCPVYLSLHPDVKKSVSFLWEA